MTSNKLLRRIDEHNYLTEREHKEYLRELNKKLELLDKYKQLEEELDIDLITIFKAIAEGIYVYDVNSNCRKVIKEEPTFILDKDIINEKKGFGFAITGRYIYLKDYGKTWALTEEELNNDSK